MKPLYNIEEPQHAYEEADIQIPEKEEEYFLLNHKHPVWKILCPIMMLIVGFIICWVGGYE